MKCAVCGKDCGRMTVLFTCGSQECLNEQARRMLDSREYWLNPFTGQVEETELSMYLRKRKREGQR